MSKTALSASAWAREHMAARSEGAEHETKPAAAPKSPPAARIATRGKLKFHPLAPGTYTGESSGYRTEDRPEHRGVDVAADYGTPIYAPSDGVLVNVGINDDPGGFGSWLWIDAQQEWGLDFVIGHVPPLVAGEP